VATITILDQTYTLPAVATTRFQTLQEQVRAQQQMIQTGVRPRPRLLGLLTRAPTPLTPEERWQELDLLIRNYDAIIAELGASQAAYTAFFSRLAAGVQQAVERQSAAMQRLEDERLADAQRPETQQDATLQRLLEEDGEQLMQGVRLLGQAALLLLKKIALCEEGLTRLVTDQDLQRRVLTELTGRLELHRRAYARRQRIQEVVQEAARMAEVALQFETYMRDHLGPLQGLLEQVVRVDSDLHQTVTEIEDLTRQLLQQQRATPLPGGEMLDERWLTFLTTSQLKKDHLVAAWEQMERQDGSLEALDIDLASSTPESASPVLTALGNIRTLVEARLAPLLPPPGGGPAAGERAISPNTPESPPSSPPPAGGRETPAPAAVAHGPSMGVSPAGETASQVYGAGLEPRLVDRFGIEFVLIAPGTFQMGSVRGNDNAQPVRTVQITKPFYLSMYPVTQRQWETIMGSNPSHFRGPEHPVEIVSWDKAQEFLRSLNTHEGRPCYRLPTEAEWEYAARAGSTGDYCFGDAVAQLGQYAWYADNAGKTTHPVGELQPNAWGLYDVHGNVWELVQDWYAAYPAGPAVDPIGPAAGSNRVNRGGSWFNSSVYCRSAIRGYDAPGHRSVNLGLRLLRTAP
jgi:formylglycine-generating enzyme required for sulfatase activity